jgi:hypothetical protein
VKIVLEYVVIIYHYNSVSLWWISLGSEFKLSFCRSSFNYSVFLVSGGATYIVEKNIYILGELIPCKS